MRHLLVLRPEPGASATVERARRRGLTAIAVPLFEVRPVEWDLPDFASFDALLLTSANAMCFGGEKLAELRGLPIHAVGAATADAAREAGFDVACVGDAGVDRLLDSLEPDLRLIHLCGKDRRTPSHARQAITPLVVYRAVEASADLCRACGSVTMIHSPRAAERFADLVDEAGIDRSSIALAAISAGAAAAAGEGWAAVESAQQPEEDALLALAKRLCNKPDRQ